MIVQILFIAEPHNVAWLHFPSQYFFPKKIITTLKIQETIVSIINLSFNSDSTVSVCLNKKVYT